MNHAQMTDQQLAGAAVSDIGALSDLVVRYLSTVASRAAGFYFDGCGFETEDLVQEGLIGLIGAVRSFDSTVGVPFRAFAIMCIDRRIHSAVRHTLCKGQVPAAAKFLPEDWDDIGSDSNSPEVQLLAKEALDNLNSRICSVASEREQQVLTLYLRGRSYRDIADQLGCTQKAVNSAMNRLRRKLRSSK